MTKQLDRKIGEDSTVADAVSALMELPEFKNAHTKIVVCHGNQRTRLAKLLFPRVLAPTVAMELQRHTFNVAPTQ